MRVINLRDKSSEEVKYVEKFPVVAAMSRGNLKAVAKRIRAKHPKNEIIIGDVGRGEREAHEAVRCAGAKVAFLPFTPEITASLNGGKPSNFNDLYRIFAKINAKEQILIQDIAAEPENGTTDYKAVGVNDGDILTNNGEEFGESLDVNKGGEYLNNGNSNWG